MSLNTMDEYWVPEHVKEYLRGLGFVIPLDDMELWIRSWDDWMGLVGTSTTIGTRTGSVAYTRFTVGRFALPCGFARSGVLFSSTRT